MKVLVLFGVIAQTIFLNILKSSILSYVLYNTNPSVWFCNNNLLVIVHIPFEQWWKVLVFRARPKLLSTFLLLPSQYLTCRFVYVWPKCNKWRFTQRTDCSTWTPDLAPKRVFDIPCFSEMNISQWIHTDCIILDWQGLEEAVLLRVWFLYLILVYIYRNPGQFQYFLYFTQLIQRMDSLCKWENLDLSFHQLSLRAYHRNLLCNWCEPWSSWMTTL